MKILITGAGRGIGAELAKQLAQEKHELFLLARSKDQLNAVVSSCNEIAGFECAKALNIDLKEVVHDHKALRSIIGGHLDSLDILVNNAGTLIRKSFEDLSLKEEREIFEVNYFAVSQMIKACIPLLKTSTRSSVINVTSMAAVQGSSKFPGLSAYSASKGALTTLTECLAEELKEDNIHVNALAFGAVQTEMLEEAFPGYKASTSPVQMGEFVKWFVVEGWQRFNGKTLQVSDSTP